MPTLPDITAPDAKALFPIEGQPSMVFLKPLVANPQIEIGEYSYYHSFDDPKAFEDNVRYLFDFIGDRLVIGVDLGLGRFRRTVWTCDLTHRYIDINADYRS